MFNRLGTYDPSNESIRRCKHKDILDKYKQISEKRQTKSNTLLESYDITNYRVKNRTTKT